MNIFHLGCFFFPLLCLVSEILADISHPYYYLYFLLAWVYPHKNRNDNFESYNLSCFASLPHLTEMLPPKAKRWSHWCLSLNVCGQKKSLDETNSDASRQGGKKKNNFTKARTSGFRHIYLFNLHGAASANRRWSNTITGWPSGQRAAADVAPCLFPALFRLCQVCFLLFTTKSEAEIVWRFAAAQMVKTSLIKDFPMTEPHQISAKNETREMQIDL